MPNRFNANPQTRFGVTGVPTGYESGATPIDTIPSCGIEDVDKALFEELESGIPFVVTMGQNNQTKKVPIIFAAGEKWAQLKNNKPIRDKNGSLILPLITIVRTGIVQSSGDDITGRGINQRVGEITVRKKLDNSDRNYQKLINKIYLKNQQNAAVKPQHASEPQLTTLNDVGELIDDPTVESGGYLFDSKKNNIYETIVIPTPQFFTANYEITFWCQYIVHMNQLLEILMNSYLQQTQGWMLTTKKGYWFVANVVDDSYTPETNFDEMMGEERFIKYKINVAVPAYTFATSVPGAPVPIKRYVSSPIVQFNLGTQLPLEGSTTVEEPFLGADDPTLPQDIQRTRREDRRYTSGTKLYPNVNNIVESDPALNSVKRGVKPTKYKVIEYVDKSGNVRKKYYRITSSNVSSGESTYSGDVELGGVKMVTTQEL